MMVAEPAGTLGTKNFLLFLSTVHCNSYSVCKHFKAKVLPDKMYSYSKLFIEKKISDSYPEACTLSRIVEQGRIPENLSLISFTFIRPSLMHYTKQHT